MNRELFPTLVIAFRVREQLIDSDVNSNDFTLWTWIQFKLEPDDDRSFGQFTALNQAGTPGPFEKWRRFSGQDRQLMAATQSRKADRQVEAAFTFLNLDK